MRTHLLYMFLFVLMSGLYIGCVSPIDITGWPCGDRDECGAGHICNGGICERERPVSGSKKPSTYRLMVGMKCRRVADCKGTLSSTVGTKKCLQGRERGLSWVEGYCSFTCTQDKDCNRYSNASYESICLNETGKTKAGICVRRCADHGDCRQDYVCKSGSGTDRSFCRTD